MVKKKVDVHFCRNTGTCSRLWHWLLHLTKATILINVTVSVTSHVLLSTQVCTSNMALWIVLRLTPSEATFFVIIQSGSTFLLIEKLLFSFLFNHSNYQLLFPNPIKRSFNLIHFHWYFLLKFRSIFFIVVQMIEYVDGISDTRRKTNT